ncbi:hypothetical protein ILUMI_15671 [Ignelater luminosus]|uniref:Uncharacterized protein n=1 Tax=Ignelater luminosus TaxID=2038154 RepID=A0A8K0CSL1_IGNLU|nr:hypothetical protein ILUMI_15671 [Ignelater luminosus]
MERMDKSVVIILKGSENWPVWKFRTVIALKAKELYDVVDNPRDENLSKDKLSKWIKRDQLAQDRIVAKMDEGLINHILTFDTAHDMCQKLLTVYYKRLCQDILQCTRDNILQIEVSIVIIDLLNRSYNSFYS